MTPIVLFGCGGHAKVIIDTIESRGQFTIEGLYDDNTPLGTVIMGYPVLGGRQQLLEHKARLPNLNLVIAIGNNKVRMDLYQQFKSEGFVLPAIVHKTAIVARDVTISPGTVVMAGVVINPSTFVGEGSIVNTRASIDHDCYIGSGVHVGPGVTLCGGVSVGQGSLLGVGSQFRPQVSVGDFVTVGAGATVVQNFESNVVIVGTPATYIKRDL